MKDHERTTTCNRTLYCLRFRRGWCCCCCCCSRWSLKHCHSRSTSSPRHRFRCRQPLELRPPQQASYYWRFHLSSSFSLGLLLCCCCSTWSSWKCLNMMKQINEINKYAALQFIKDGQFVHQILNSVLFSPDFQLAFVPYKLLLMNWYREYELWTEAHKLRVVRTHCWYSSPCCLRRLRRRRWCCQASYTCPRFSSWTSIEASSTSATGLPPMGHFWHYFSRLG